MRAELRDSLEFLFSDSPVSDLPCAVLAVDVARGGTAAAHVLLNGLPAGGTLRLEAEGQWFRLVDVPVEQNTGRGGFVEGEEVNPFVIRRAPFRVFDAMQPIAAEVPVTAPIMALRLHMPIAADAPAGARTVPIRLTCGGETVDLRLEVTVYPVTIPPVGAGSFPYTNWFSLEAMAERHDLAPWCEAHWALIARYAALMAHGRQNTFILFQGSFVDVVDGRPVVNAARLRRLVEVFTHAGLHFIEGGHFGGRTTEDWFCPTFSLTVTKSLATTAEGNADIAAISRQLMAEIAANGWAERWLQHVADEPIAENSDNYRIFVGMVRKYMPGIPIVDATMYEGLVGAVDVWCPKAEEYQPHAGFFDTQRAVGDRVWFYTCCTPGGGWLNRLLDMELLRPALFGWGAVRFGLDGFLHWGLNHYRADQDPFAQSVVGHPGDVQLPAGDTHIIYPGSDGPWSSVRLEAQREGFEDYELLRQLPPDTREAILAPVLRAFDDFMTDTAVFRAGRRAVLEALA
jgi:hypothetical protein